MIITEDGKYALRPTIRGFAGNRMIVYVSGVFGTALLQLQYKDLFGNFINLEDGQILNESQSVVDAGTGAVIWLDVSQTDGSTNIAVEARGVI